MKKIISVFFALLLLTFSVLCVNVSAASDMAIASVHFDASVNADGTVSVTETWNVEYMSTGDGFTRWIDMYDSVNSNNMAAVEKFDSITNIAVKVDGKEIAEAQSGANTFRYGESADGRSLNIEINSPTALAVKEYTVSYTVNGAVKQNGNKAEFAYVFIGETFEYRCNNVSASISFPEGVDGDDIVFDEESTGLLNGAVVEFSPRGVSETFRVDVKCNDDVFEDGALASYSAFKEGLKKAGGILLDILYWLFVAAVAVLVIVLALFTDKLRRHSIEKNAKKLITDEVNAETKSLPAELSSCEAYKMLVPYSKISPKTTSKKVPYLFAMAVLECAEKGYIVEDNGNLLVGTPSGDAPEYILSVLNFLKTFSDKNGNRYVINAQFADKVKAECMSSYDVMTNYLGTFYNLIPSADGKFFKDSGNKELYEKAYVLKTCVIGDKTKTSFSDCMRKVLAGAKAGDREILALLFTSGSASKVFADTANDGVSALACAIAEMYNVFIKSK